MLSTADSHPSNVVAERGDAAEHEHWIHMYFRCCIHRLDTCEKRTTDIMPSVISGMVNLGQYFVHNMPVFRDALRKIIRSKVRWVARASSDAAQEHRSKITAMFARSESLADTRRRLAWSHLFNGDLSDRDVIQHVEHGCCKNLEDTAEKMCAEGLSWLLDNWVAWSRKSWTGHDEALDFVGGVEATDGLFSRGLQVATSSSAADGPCPGGDVANNT